MVKWSERERGKQRWNRWKRARRKASHTEAERVHREKQKEMKKRQTNA